MRWAANRLRSEPWTKGAKGRPAREPTGEHVRVQALARKPQLVHVGAGKTRATHGSEDPQPKPSFGHIAAMTRTGFVNADLAQLRDGQKRLLTTLAWGDRVEIEDDTNDQVKVAAWRFRTRPDGSIEPIPTPGFLRKKLRSTGEDANVLTEASQSPVLKVDFVDVQQGDASVIETPGGKVMLVDGGDNQLFARYLASRYPATSKEAPQEIECIVVTHGDADHFAGLTEIRRSESHDLLAKRLFIHPNRVFHNGLVKRPSEVPEAQQLGSTTDVGDITLITELEDDLLAVDDAKMNRPFRAWKAALKAFSGRGPIEFRRLALGDDAFSFLSNEGISVEVLGPIPTTKQGITGLEFLGAPRKGPQVGHRSLAQNRFIGKSASHTINGHSIVFRLTYGKWSFLYAGDLNEQSEERLVQANENGELELRSEVFKVPHHGSADFLHNFLKAVHPVISVVSSGDESSRKEYIHPRATLMSALGKYGRETDPVVFVTELVAFFEAVGWVRNAPPAGDKRKWSKRTDPFFAFNRTAFGIVKVRTDGDRLLVYTNSGQDKLKEAYAYTLSNGKAIPTAVRQA